MFLRPFALPYAGAVACRMESRCRYGVTGLPFHTARRCPDIRRGNAIPYDAPMPFKKKGGRAEIFFIFLLTFTPFPP